MTPDELAAIRERADQAAEHVGRLCTKEDRWTMSVPPRESDSDILLMQSLDKDIPALLAALDEARAEADTWHMRFLGVLKDQAAIWAVRDLHSPIELKGKPDPYCRHCLTAPGPWPCHTIRALGETP